jgi:hypothetical protein
MDSAGKGWRAAGKTAGTARWQQEQKYRRQIIRGMKVAIRHSYDLLQSVLRKELSLWKT